MGAVLSSLWKCIFYPRLLGQDGGPGWRELFAPEMPEHVDACDLVIRDAWFRPDLCGEHFIPGQRLKEHHFPVVWMRVVFELPFLAAVVEGWRDRAGKVDLDNFRCWDEATTALVSYIQWELRQPLRGAIPDLMHFLIGSRTGLVAGGFPRLP